MFHCGLCTYAAITKAHLSVHAYFAHAKQVSWYKGNSDTNPVLLDDEFKYLVLRKRYCCALTSACQFSCLRDEVFRGHLEGHGGSSPYRCHLCFGSEETCGRLLHHYQINHGFSSVQCLYCDFASNDDWIVMRHVMEQHPRRPFRMLLRNGDTAAVCQRLRLLMQDYLTMDPLKLAQPCAQLPLESQTQVNVTSSNEEAIPEVGPLTLERSSEVKPSLDQSCKSKFMSSLCLQVKEKSVESHAASSDTCIGPQNSGRMSPLSTEESLCPSSECSEHFATLREATESLHSSAHTSKQNFALEPDKPQPLHESERTSSLADSWYLACNAESCSMEFGAIFDYLNHLTECHPLETSFLCPKCDLTVSSADISVHLVERHSGFLFCPYQGCSFGSHDQCGLDDHIIQAHQVYQEEDRDSSVAEGEGEPCTTASTGCSMNYTNAGSIDFTPAMEICNEGRNGSFHCEVNLKDSTSDLAKQLFCGMCSTRYSTLSCYVYHMAFEHSVPYICGYCLKPYKKSRCLLMHAGCLHLGQPFSVFCVSDEKVTDIGLKVAPSWIKEAQQYLGTVHPGRMHAKGKTMVKNLKRAVTYLSSACFEGVSNAESQSGPSQLQYDSASPRTFCNGSSSSSGTCLSQFGVVPDQFKDFGMDLVSTSPPQSQNTSPSKSRPNIAMSAKLKILGSVYIDTSSCKRVNGKIVLDNEVLQKIQELNAVKLPMNSSLTEVSGALYSRLHEGCHMCSECPLTFDTFQTLAKHIVKLHNQDIINGSDLASAVLSPGDNWDLQGSTSKRDVKQPRSTEQLLFERMQSKDPERLVDDCTLVCVNSNAVKVPYSEFSRAKDLNPVVKLVRLPVIKNEPKC